VGSSFKINQPGLDKIGKEATKNYAALMQQVLDRLAQTQNGKPLDQVKRALKTEWERAGNKISDPELTKWAGLLSSGTRIELRTS
jgi:hypothetical protein